ncbi:DUF881 domain-containing protein [uncultured Jatrophihabitans sp.]|uniref:DUF881 domain-containing protein n=1 Tax=uncultured Jatrophihabitans sp. TaxID=1610747 RepID=UPI0035CB0A1A
MTDDPDAPDDHDDHDDQNQTARRRLPGRRAPLAVIGVLTLLLGFAIAVQVHANSSSDSLSALRDDDLIGILDNQSDRADRLRQQISQLQANLRQLQDTGNRSAAARKQAAAQAQALGVLTGTLPATGPGITVTVTDPSGKLDGEDLLDVIEELRGAGAEAIEVGAVRVGTNTAFEGTGGSLTVDGTTMHTPYTVIAVGESKTLDTALNIPGGVAATVRAAGGELTVVEHATVTIRAIRAAQRTKYAHTTH